MPWSKDKTLPSLKNKSDEIKALFAGVANKVLSETQDEEKAIQAGLSAVSKKEGKVRVKKSTTMPETPPSSSSYPKTKGIQGSRKATGSLRSPFRDVF